MKKHGLENFEFSILDTAQTLEELNTKEKHYLDLAKANGEVYNLREAGLNKTHSEESKLRMSESQKRAHERRRNNGGDGGWTRKDGGPMKGKKWGENHRGKLPEVIAKRRDWISKNKDEFINAIKNGLDTKGKTWKLIDGKRVWMEKI
jgi:group I intron endonuclease